MKKLEHIGIAVKDLKEANNTFSRLLGVDPYKTEEVSSEGVRTSFFEVSGIKIELLESTHDDSPIAKFIAKRGEGIHHLAFAVEEIENKIGTLKEEGFTPLGVPKEGADNMKICFLHPKQTHGVLIELCEKKPI